MKQQFKKLWIAKQYERKQLKWHTNRKLSSTSLEETVNKMEIQKRMNDQRIMFNNRRSMFQLDSYFRNEMN